MTEIERDIAVWWPTLPEAVRAELSAKLDREPLSTDAVIAITNARGVGPAAAHFIDAGPVEHPRFFLAHDDYEWIAMNRELCDSRAALDAAIPDDPGAIERAIPDDPGAIDRAIPRDDQAFKNLFPNANENIRDMRF